MDSLLPLYKDFTTSRDLNYHYYFSAADSGKPYILFVHGFPSVSADWFQQIAYFKEKGYGIIAPDMLGYGGTDKPTDAASYVHTSLAKDLIDILDHEKITEVLAIGHDWGSKTTSILANLYSDRFLAFGFLSVGYNAPNTQLGYDQMRVIVTKALGYESIGYWEFFSAPDANEIVTKHIESFWDVLHAKDPQVWTKTMCPIGGLRAFLESDSRADRAEYVPEQLVSLYKEDFAKHGFAGPLNYYKIMTEGLDLEDAKKIPVGNYVIQKPVFFGGTAKDPICVPALQQATISRLCPKATSEVFQTGHWVMLEAPKELNEALDKWISSVIS